jgi:hypothetical protein
VDTLSRPPHGATGKARLWINWFMLCSGQEANATVQPRHTDAREPEGRAIWIREFVGAKHRTHQANVVVIRSDEEQVTYFVRQHASQRASKIVVVHEPAARGAAYCSTGQHALGRVERHANRSRARAIPLDGCEAQDRRPGRQARLVNEPPFEDHLQGETARRSPGRG